MRCWTSCNPRVVKPASLLCALTLALNGCIHSAGLTGVGANALPPAPTTPGAVVTDEYICLPHAEAAELLLWIEHAEAQCR